MVKIPTRAVIINVVMALETDIIILFDTYYFGNVVIIKKILSFYAYHFIIR